MNNKLLCVVVVSVLVVDLVASREEIESDNRVPDRASGIKTMVEYISDVVCREEGNQQLQNICEPVGIVAPFVAGCLCCFVLQRSVNGQLEKLQKVMSIYSSEQKMQ